MKKVDAKFLNEVQRAGWHITQATTEHVIARCPSANCCLNAKLEPDGVVPEIGKNRDPKFSHVLMWDDIRRILRQRREELGLSIGEVEHVLGVATDYIAKMENDNFSKEPSIFILLCWCEVLGLNMGFIRQAMPSVVLKQIEATRDRAESRMARAAIERKHRAAKLG